MGLNKMIFCVSLENLKLEKEIPKKKHCLFFPTRIGRNTILSEKKKTIDALIPTKKLQLLKHMKHHIPKQHDFRHGAVADRSDWVICFREQSTGCHISFFSQWLEAETAPWQRKSRSVHLSKRTFHEGRHLLPEPYACTRDAYTYVYACLYLLWTDAVGNTWPTGCAKLPKPKPEPPCLLCYKYYIYIYIYMQHIVYYPCCMHRKYVFAKTSGL